MITADMVLMYMSHGPKCKLQEKVEKKDGQKWTQTDSMVTHFQVDLEISTLQKEHLV